MKNKIIITSFLIIIISMCSFMPIILIHANPWWSNIWIYKTKITIDQLMVDADLTDFPILVHLTSSQIDWTHVQDDLDDLRFVDSTETIMLKAELEKYTINDEAWIWVKIPTISGTVDTDFYMYYENVVATSAWDAENVWDSSAVMVQHMRDATTSTILDSTSYDNDGAKLAANEPLETATGKIDSAQSFDDINDYINCGSNGSLDNLVEFTYILWIHPDIEGANKGLIYKNNHVQFLHTDHDKIYGLVYTPPNYGVSLSSTALIIGEYNHVALTYNDIGDRKIRLYINGAEVSYTLQIVTTNAMLDDSATNLVIGRHTDAGITFDGGIDETRNYNIIQSAEWIKADYNSGADTLLTYGTEVGIVEIPPPNVIYPEGFPFTGLVSFILIIIVIGFIVFRR